jgi:hypothetical protein
LPNKASIFRKTAAGFLHDSEPGGSGFAVPLSKFATVYFPFTAND